MKGEIIVVLVCVLLSLTSPVSAKMVKSTTVENGKKVTRWTNEENAQKTQEQQKENAAQAEGYRNAVKRKAGDPIFVALFRPIVPEQYKKIIDEGKLFEMLRKEFENDPVIKLIDQDKVDSASEKNNRMGHRKLFSSPHAQAVNADVSIFTTVTFEKEVGINKSTKKLGEYTALVMNGEVISHYLPEDNYKVREKGYFLKNVQVVKDFSAKAKTVVIDRIGPNIPAENAGQQGKADSEELKEELSDFFKALKGKKR